MNPALRKAALLIKSLDPAGAEAVLAQMDATAAARVREAARTLRRIDPAEQQQVLEEFFAQGGEGTSARGVLAPAERLAAASADEVMFQHAAATPTPAPRRPFQFLETIEAAQLALRLGAEHPQTIALVAAHAPRALAAELLWRLPDSLRAEVLLRVIDWQGTDPQLLEELERALELSLRAAPATANEVVGLEAARAILQAAPADERGELLDGLARRDAQKANLLRFTLQEAGAPPSKTTGESVPFVPVVPFVPTNAHPEAEPPPAAEVEPPLPDPGAARPRFTFADFLRFDDRTLSRVFAAVDAPTALLALAGADPRLVARLMKRLPRQEAARLRRRLESLGPFRLRDVELAQDKLARVADRLAEERSIRVAQRRRAA